MTERERNSVRPRAALRPPRPGLRPLGGHRAGVGCGGGRPSASPLCARAVRGFHGHLLGSFGERSRIAPSEPTNQTMLSSQIFFFFLFLFFFFFPSIFLCSLPPGGRCRAAAALRLSGTAPVAPRNGSAAAGTAQLRASLPPEPPGRAFTIDFFQLIVR